MGCGPSSQRRASPETRPNISAPTGGLELIPQPRRDAAGMPLPHQHHDLDRLHLQRALTYAADHLHSKGADIMIIAVGGAVNTILLETRESTHDVDFFMPSDRRQQGKLIEEAAQVAEARSSLPLGGEWLNNSASLYIPRTIRQELSQEAIAQNAVVFRRPGLTILAAPWIYALCAKIQRLGDTRKRRSYDATDAATYLYHFNSQHGQHSVQFQYLVERAAHYQTAITADVCRQLDAEYQTRYGKNGIAFQ
ncbi:MAG: hypothetical protein Q9163_002126 [Psora crenata]